MTASAAIARRPHHRTPVQNLRRLTCKSMSVGYCPHLRELATERANSLGFARSVWVVSQNATLPVAFSLRVMVPIQLGRAQPSHSYSERPAAARVAVRSR